MNPRSLSAILFAGLACAEGPTESHRVLYGASAEEPYAAAALSQPIRLD
jgi:hypothetical protein